jgi:hypothetical protein
VGKTTKKPAMAAQHKIVLKSSLPPIKEKTCTVEKCSARHYAKGFCKKHYAQVLKHGKLAPERERGAIRVCKVEKCGRTDTINWYCRKHARQIRVYGKLTPEREHVMGRQGCVISKCKEKHRAKGFCTRHYNQSRYNAKMGLDSLVYLNLSSPRIGKKKATAISAHKRKAR